MKSSLPEGLALSSRVRAFAASRLVDEGRAPLAAADLSSTELHCAGTRWEVGSVIDEPEPGVLDLRVRFTLREGEIAEANLNVALEVADWKTSNYVFIPAAAYDGNRFPAREIGYPPLLDRPFPWSPGDPPVISDVPRLNHGPGPSRLQLLAGDAAHPTLGYYDPEKKMGALLSTAQKTALGESGLLIEESDDRSSALFLIGTPGVRSETCYKLCSTRAPSPDCGARFTPGNSHEIALRLACFPAADLDAFFRHYHHTLQLGAAPPTLRHDLPLSAAFSIIEEKYNRDNWNPAGSYYGVGLRNDRYQDWQIGWTGGLISTLPLLFAGGALSRRRALDTFDFVFTQGGQGPAGFFHGCHHNGVWSGDGFHYPGCDHYHMTRKSADALFFAVKQFDLLRRQDPAWQLPAAWQAGTLACADAFVRLWKTAGEFGQFVDVRTGELIVGGSASAAIAPAGLAWAARFFDRPDYLEAARRAALFYDENFVRRGLTNAGPGEILQCPDSESAIALVESFVALWEVTQESAWLARAEAAALQCLTWMMPYDYAFPPASLFGRLGMKSAGSIWANAQNKHSAPGYCTLSGDCLFKLHRATGDPLYRDSLLLTAHNLTQYLSRTDRPIGGLQPGWINERVNTSDWLEPPGEIFNGSCWPEISCLLTAVEIPGLYARFDTGAVTVFDHVDVTVLDRGDDFFRLRIGNPTSFSATVRVLSENAAAARRPLGLNALFSLPTLTFQPGETRIVFLQPPPAN